MDLKDAIAYIKTWREEQKLDALPPDIERVAASKLLAQKGWNLPEKIPDFDGNLYLIDGAYVKPDTMKTTDTVEIQVEIQQPAEIKPPNPFPWEPGDKREFWCEKLKSFVRMTGDLNADGIYYVNKVGDGAFRRYPVKGQDLVLKEQAPADAPSTDLLAVNRASWTEIKNFLIEKFIPSYPWSRKGEKTPADVRADMELLAKSKNKGLGKLIEEERRTERGSYEDSQNFTMRLTALHESFPWAEFAQMLDFCQ
ncbi:hypothetical protein G7B40_001450 [Aetokthonos hydrillicola Thurmond2011]|jgi:hypothetical protein|uniref:Uncharacterized protein n=1 Tax=Aetokthonos hydrillicola Thurmond2011 TaxID=2712845 RepID=A0AAP5I215_9CYAN|nr:hypothetical protein [Aetokthonos hydrillicola]MBO3463130.1 hypothetical protein [Aetokthonos hydrillicola CCALA 1050]MBW4591086.1 hypothetical protein [Aetokthonos hydrillicola CCALA 1050]MDR9893251.1 hypothetical protein [Aetokthonos hydrillicola Thurmond2011]